MRVGRGSVDDGYYLGRCNDHCLKAAFPKQRLRYIYEAGWSARCLSEYLRFKIHESDLYRPILYRPIRNEPILCPKRISPFISGRPDEFIRKFHLPLFVFFQVTSHQRKKILVHLRVNINFMSCHVMSCVHFLLRIPEYIVNRVSLSSLVTPSHSLPLC